MKIPERPKCVLGLGFRKRKAGDCLKLSILNLMQQAKGAAGPWVGEDTIEIAFEDQSASRTHEVQKSEQRWFNGERRRGHEGTSHIKASGGKGVPHAANPRPQHVPPSVSTRRLRRKPQTQVVRSSRSFLRTSIIPRSDSACRALPPSAGAKAAGGWAPPALCVPRKWQWPVVRN